MLTSEEQVLSALSHNLDGQALSTWMAMTVTGTPVESFVSWIERFNVATPEERGKGKYDHSRTLDENVDVTVELTTGSGFPLTATLHKNGEITLATPLSQ